MRFFIFSFLFLLTASVDAVQWWGKKLDSLKYIMPTEGFLLDDHVSPSQLYLGLEGFGIDRITYQDQKLTRYHSYRFEDIIDKSVGIRSILPHKNFLVVGGIVDGFLALDPSEEYPSKKSKAHSIVYKPDPETEVYASVIKSLSWKDYVLLLTPDQVTFSEMPDALTFRSRSQVGLAPQAPKWQEYWATDMILSDDNLYVLLSHPKTPGVIHLKLKEKLSDIEKFWTPLPEEMIYVKSLEMIDQKLYVAQNQSLIMFDRESDGKLIHPVVHQMKYFVDSIIAMPNGFGLSYWNNGFAFYENGVHLQETSIVFPPRRFFQAKAVLLDQKTVLFVSGGEEGFFVFEEY